MRAWRRYASGRYLKYLLFEAFGRDTTVERDGFRLRIDRSIPRVNRRYLFHKFDRYEDDEVELLRTILNPGDRVLELGAGLGIVSLYINRIVSDGGFLVAVEANHDAFVILEQNLSMAADNYTCLEGLASLEEGTARFFVNRRNLHLSSRDEEPSTEHECVQVVVPCLSVSRLVSKYRVNSLVMDIENGEREILEGFDLIGIDKLACEFHPAFYGQETMHRLIRIVEARGFERVGASGDSVAFRRKRMDLFP
jgi:FkbM family methyltransferase